MSIDFDLISSLAQLNVAYLGIAIGIIALVIGAFYLFSVSPLKEALSKQEKDLINFKNLLTKRVSRLESDTLGKVKAEFDLEIKNISRNFQSMSSNEINKIKDDLNKNNTKLLLNLDEKIEKFRENDIKDIKINQTKIDDLFRKQEKESQTHINNLKDLINKNKLEIKEIEYRIMELESFKFSQQGKMGAIIRQIGLLESDLKDKRWNLKYRLRDLKKELESVDLTPDLATKLRELLKQITEEGFNEIIEEIKSLINVKID